MVARSVGSTCRICLSADGAETLQVREMMFGVRDAFDYELCDTCGSLQISTIPADLGQYYANAYYAHSEPEETTRQKLRDAFLTWSTSLILWGPGVLLALLERSPALGRRIRCHPLRSLRNLRLRRDSPIADVGGGNGLLLRALSRLGFTDLTCIDPFIDADDERGGIRYVKGHLAEQTRRFALLMYHHSMEHVPDLESELRVARDRLTESGRLLVRMPLLPNAAFEHYRENWIQIDAPRHVHIVSRSGFETVAKRCGLRVVESGDDSTAFQYWGSEGYSKDIPLHDSPHYRQGRKAFARGEFGRLSRQADALNAVGKGDQGWFVLKIDPTDPR